VGIAAFADFCIDFVGVCWLDFVWFDIACCFSDEPRRATDISVTDSFFVVPLCQGEEDRRDSPLAL
jgi:hypothetical protein